MIKHMDDMVVVPSDDRTLAAGVARMDPELKATWVAALRCGKYEQTANDLHNYRGYCCLGVLHHLVTGSEPEHAWGRGCEKPKEIALIGHAIQQLANMNDIGKTFPEIADWIEANL